jgi:hypothetical protein
MPRCSCCGRELPGFETTCRECFEARYENFVRPKPWWHRLLPRFERGNLVGSCALFVLSFAIMRFDFPYGDNPASTENSLALSVVIACTAFFHQGRKRPNSQPSADGEGRTDWGRLALMAAIELMAGAVIFFSFTYLPKAVAGGIALLGIMGILIDITDPIRTRSLGCLLRRITGAGAAFCLLAWRVSGQELWENLALTGFILIAGLSSLDRWEVSK